MPKMSINVRYLSRDVNAVLCIVHWCEKYFVKLHTTIAYYQDLSKGLYQCVRILRFWVFFNLIFGYKSIDFVVKSDYQSLSPSQILSKRKEMKKLNSRISSKHLLSEEKKKKLDSPKSDLSTRNIEVFHIRQHTFFIFTSFFFRFYNDLE